VFSGCLIKKHPRRHINWHPTLKLADSILDSSNIESLFGCRIHHRDLSDVNKSVLLAT